MPCYCAGGVDIHRHMTHYGRPDFELDELIHEYSLGSVRNVRRVGVARPIKIGSSARPRKPWLYGVSPRGCLAAILSLSTRSLEHLAAVAFRMNCLNRFELGQAAHS